jgi:hypothetical protein
MQWLKQGRMLALALAVSASGGCMAAAVGAGAGAGVYLNSQGATSMVSAPSATVAARVPAALSALGITVTGHSLDGDEHEWSGTRGGEEIHVQVKAQSSGTSEVSASARKNMAEWDKDFARTIVARISGN